jgi:hypothetical protein
METMAAWATGTSGATTSEKRLISAIYRQFEPEWRNRAYICHQEAGKMRNLASIKRIVVETLRRDFDHTRILDVEIHEDVDFDGEDVLRINVIFEGTPKDLNAKKLSGAVRLLRPKLDKIHESAFPLLSFISKADHDKRASA